MYQPSKQILDRELPWNKLNVGLYFNKYFDEEDIREKGQGEKKDNNNKSKVNKAVSYFKKSNANLESVKTHVNRQKNLIKSKNGKIINITSNSRTVVGMGIPHPLKNGLLFHHTIGMPYIPGSSIKGMVRAWAEQNINSDEEKEVFKRIFGSNPFIKSDNNEKTDGTNIGNIIFLDALPLKLKYCEDIMTPHYSKYYGEKEFPADWDSPNIIKFLAIEDASFQLGIIPRSKNMEKEIDLTYKWLKEAFEILGIGAKTAVGYGRYEVTD